VCSLDEGWRKARAIGATAFAASMGGVRLSYHCLKYLELLGADRIGESAPNSAIEQK
jgi:hypothetical protein